VGNPSKITDTGIKNTAEVENMFSNTFKILVTKQLPTLYTL
jgi:hypothetical protein